MSKYGAKRTMVGDIAFDSEIEAKYYTDLILPSAEAGRIKEYKLQPRYELQPKFKHKGKFIAKIEYVADFEITWDDGTVQIVDIKGMATETALLKRKLFIHKFPTLDLVWLCYVKKWGGWVRYDELKELRKANKRAKK